MSADVAPFTVWYRQAHPRLLGAVTVIEGDAHLARDAVDEACARAFAQWGRVAAMANPSGWVYRVALDVARRWRHKAARADKVLSHDEA